MQTWFSVPTEGMAAVPVAVGMVAKLRQQINNIPASEWTSGILRAILTAVALAVVGYAMGIPKLEERQMTISTQVNEVKADIAGVKSDVKAVQAAVTSDKLVGTIMDASLDKRVSIIEAQHDRIINDLKVHSIETRKK